MLDDELHLWRIATDAALDLSALRQTLSADEQAKADRFRFASDQRRSIVRRAALRQILAGYLGVAPGAVRFAYGPRGKPALDEPFAASGWHFNVSFSAELALCVVARQPLGVDLERQREVEDAALVAKHFFTPGEIALQNSADDANRVFLRHWTRKEALVKAAGRGLSVPLNLFDVSWLPDGGWRQVTLPDAEGQPAAWWLCDLSAGPDWSAALASASPAAQVHWREWPPLRESTRDGLILT